MAEYIERDTVLRCIKESRDGINWGQSEDGDAFLHYSACLYRTIASAKCIPAADVVEVVRCRDCRYFETDAWANVNGIPIIVAHEMCRFWGGGYKTSSGAYCSYGVKRDG